MLALNSGSSSLKVGLYAVVADTATCLYTEALRPPVAQAGAGEASTVLRNIRQGLIDRGLPAAQAIGHRVVHGGPSLREPVRLDATALGLLEAARAFAPLHMPAMLALAHGAEASFPGLPQVACFDTGFHAAMPDVARVLPLPRALEAEGIHRYGFHGLSCESIVHQLAGALPRRLLIAHLGFGASVTAVHNGVSVDTSMGLTPTGGMLMGTRSGDLDPGVLLHLMRSRGLDADALERLVNRHSGLAGISGSSGDMRSLHLAAATNADAQLAIEMFCYATAKQLAAMAVGLGGVDSLVFTGGIGENDAAVRATVCARLGFIGTVLDEALNREGLQAPGGLISREGARRQVRVLPSLEDEQIARHTAAAVFSTAQTFADDMAYRGR